MENSKVNIFKAGKCVFLPESNYINTSTFNKNWGSFFTFEFQESPLEFGFTMISGNLLEPVTCMKRRKGLPRNFTAHRISNYGPEHWTSIKLQLI